MTKKRDVTLILVLISGAIAATCMTRLYRINHRWLLWTPLQSEVWVWPVDDPNDIEYHALVPRWLDPNCRFLPVDVGMPKNNDGRDRMIRLEFKCRMIDMREFAKE